MPPNNEIGSVLASIEVKETRLIAAIEKSEILLRLIKHPDFVFLNARDILLSQGDCIVSLARLKKLRLQKQSEIQTPSSTELIHEVEMLLANALAIYMAPECEIEKSGSVGRIQVLLELGELQAITNRPTDAVATFAEAISLCYDINDRSTENLLMNKLQAVQLDIDTIAYLDQVVSDLHENANEKQILYDCFLRVATTHNETPCVTKDQIKGIARELGIKVPLSSSELDEIWHQIITVPSQTTHELDLTSTTISFDKLWRWWMSESMYEYRSTRCKRLK